MHKMISRRFEDIYDQETKKQVEKCCLVYEEDWSCGNANGHIEDEENPHPKKMHCHSHKKYQLLLIRPKLRKGRKERWVHKTWMKLKMHRLQEKEMFRLRAMAARKPSELPLPIRTL